RRRRLACALVSGMGAALSLATCVAAHVLIQRHGSRAALLLHSALMLVLGPLAALLLRARTPLVPCALPWGVPLGCVLLSALLGTCARTLHVLSLPAHMRRMHEDPAHAMYALMTGFTGGTLAGAWMDAWCWCCVAGEVVCGVAALAVWTPAKGPAPVVAACVGVGLGAGMCAVGIVGYVGRQWGGGAVARVLGCVGLAAAAGALLAAPAAVEFERSAPGNTQWLAALAGVLSLGAAALAALPMLPAVKQREAGEQDRSGVTPPPPPTTTGKDALPTAPLTTTAEFLEWFDTATRHAQHTHDQAHHAYARHLHARVAATRALMHTLRESTGQLASMTQALEQAQAPAASIASSSSGELERLEKAYRGVTLRLADYDALRPLDMLVRAPGDACDDVRFLPALERAEQAARRLARVPVEGRDGELYAVRFAQARARALALIRMHLSSAFRRMANQGSDGEMQRG
ncbi:hypothetical protein LPJ73_006586, partial [Coemansia sp. RSA 2703]